MNRIFCPPRKKSFLNIFLCEKNEHTDTFGREIVKEAIHRRRESILKEFFLFQRIALFKIQF